MKQTFRHEKGQSIVIIAVAMIGLIGLLALVVDGGNAYVQRRQTQNAVDAATQAGTIAFTQNKTGSQILAVVQQYAGANGMDTTKVTAYYVVQDSSLNPPANYVVPSPAVGTGAGKDNVITHTVYNTKDLPIVGIQVVGDKTFPTYFAGIVGFKQMSTNVVSASFAKCGSCSANSLFPIAVSGNMFTVFGVKTQQTDANPGNDCGGTGVNSCYKIYENGTLGSQGSYGYVQWTGSSATIASNMNNTENNVSASWRVNDSLSGNSATTADSTIFAAFLNRVNGTPSQFVTVPVYDTASPGLGTPGAQTYTIKGFARFQITGYYFSSTQKGGNYDKMGTIVNGDKFIIARLQQWDDPQANGGCPNYGICTVHQDTPPQPEVRQLAGTVNLNKLTTNQKPIYGHQPVDVMEVIDLSPSMANDFNNSSTSNTSLMKITAAKAALNNFNGQMIQAKTANITNTLWTDQLGLTTFPYIFQTSPGYYSPDCKNAGPSSNKNLFYNWQTGFLKSGLNGSVTSMNSISSTITAYNSGNLPSGNTPTAGAIKVATDALVTNHIKNNVPVMIIATDGRANVLSDGRFEGDSIDLDPCNNAALQAATDQATLAKGKLLDGFPITIFVIASGSEYKTNASLQSYFKAVASVDTNLPHFFAADNAQALNDIFTALSTRIQNIGNEACKVTQTQAFGKGFQLVATNTSTGKTYPITADPNTGDFTINNVDPGTYTFTSANNYVPGNPYNYNIFTKGVGGTDYPSAPSVTVGNDTGTYPVDLYLRTGDTPTCN